MTRNCTKCKQDKALDDFYAKQSWCKGCYREWHRSRYVPKNGTDDAPRDCVWCGASYRPKTRRHSTFCSSACKEAERKASGRGRDQHLMRKFGMTQADYDAMLAAQGGGCALCGTRPEDQQARYSSFLHVDHDHATGRVRGLLCAEHNLLLGRFNDDPALLRRAVEYLEASAS